MEFSLSVKVWGEGPTDDHPSPVFVYPSGEPWLTLALRRGLLTVFLFAPLGALMASALSSCHVGLSFPAPALDYRIGLYDRT